MVRGSIGISFQQDLPAAVGRVYGFKSGVLVSSVAKGGPAEQAGIKVGDIITSVDGKPIKDGDDLVNTITARHPGSTAKVGYLRNGQQQSATVTIQDRTKTVGSLTGQNNAPNENGPGEEESGPDKLGVTAVNLPQQLTSKGVHGVLIQQVKPGSFADEIGLAQGAVINEINKTAINNKSDYTAAVSALKSGQDVVVSIIDPRRSSTGNFYRGGTLPLSNTFVLPKIIGTHNFRGCHLLGCNLMNMPLVSPERDLPTPGRGTRMFRFSASSTLALGLALMVSPALAATLSTSHKSSTLAGSTASGTASLIRWVSAGIAPERATQIQNALIHQNYLTGSPSGQWDSQTEAAMQKYQADHGWQTKLTPDSRALIALGLGPTTASGPQTLPANTYNSPSRLNRRKPERWLRCTPSHSRDDCRQYEKARISGPSFLCPAPYASQRN